MAKRKSTPKLRYHEIDFTKHRLQRRILVRLKEIIFILAKNTPEDVFFITHLPFYHFLAPILFRPKSPRRCQELPLRFLRARAFARRKFLLTAFFVRGLSIFCLARSYRRQAQLASDEKYSRYSSSRTPNNARIFETLSPRPCPSRRYPRTLFFRSYYRYSPRKAPKARYLYAFSYTFALDAPTRPSRRTPPNIPVYRTYIPYCKN